MPDALTWGVSGGIGQALVSQLNAAGWRVFAAARNIASISDGVVYNRYHFDSSDHKSKI